jgi:hypothetical protein
VVKGGERVEKKMKREYSDMKQHAHDSIFDAVSVTHIGQREMVEQRNLTKIRERETPDKNRRQKDSPYGQIHVLQTTGPPGSPESLSRFPE